MLYTPLLPEAASGTLEPRHCVVPLREMCPHAELILGSVTALDLEAKTAAVETPDGPQTVGWTGPRARARRGAAHAADPGPRGARALLQDARRRDQPPQPGPAPARGGRRGARRAGAGAAADIRLRRRRLRGRRGARRAVRPRRGRAPLLPAPALDAAPLGARRRGAADPARHPAAARRLRGGRAAQARDRDPRRDDARVGLRRRGRARERDADPDEHGRLDGRRRAEPRPARVVAAGRREGPRRGGRVPPRARARARLGARRLRARPEHAQRPARPAHLPARAAPGPATREEPDRAAEAVRLPHARPGRDARPPQGNRGGARPATCTASSAGG